MKPSLIIFLSFIALGSCSQNSSYDIKESKVPEKFIVQKIVDNISSKEDIYNISEWWKSYNDPLLNKMVEDGLSSNLDILEGIESINEAKIKLKLVGIDSDFNAKLRGSSTVTEEHNLDSTSNKDTTKENLAGLAISFTPDIFGKEKPEQEFALAELSYQQNKLRATTLKVTSDIVKAYITLRASQEQLSYQNNSVKLQKDTLSAVTERFNVGLSPELDRQRAINAVEIMKSDLPTIRGSTQQSTVNLCNLVNEYADSYSFLLSKFNKTPRYKSSLPYIIPANIISLNPDIRKSEDELKKALANIGIADAARYPTFSISGQIDFGNQHLSSTNMTNVLIGSIGAIVEQTLFDSGKTSTNVKLAKKQTDIYMIRYQKAINDTLQNIENAFISIKANSDRIKTLEKAVIASEKSVDQADMLYKNGIIDLLDLIDTQKNLSSNKIKLSQARASYNIEIANLFLLLGTSN